MLRSRSRRSRYLAAVVFTDIAGSTEVAARLGDEGWKRLLERHLRVVRGSLHRFGGREIDTAGDGVYATFESPALAIEFALDVAQRVEPLGIQVRSGVHMGEVEVIGGKVGGIAVHIGARIGALAEPGKVLVSGTVRDLVTGSAIAFEDRGTTELKGVPGTWALYSATALERHEDLPVEVLPPLRERVSTTLRSTRARVLVVLAAVVALVGSGLAVNQLLQPRYLPGAEANSVGRISEGGGGIVSAAQVGSLPDAIAVGEGAVWVTDTTTGSLERIDPQDGRLVQTISVGNSPNAVAVGHGAVWVANGGDRTVSRVSPETNKEVAPVTVGNGPSGVATDERWVWATNRLDGTLARIDPRTDDVEYFQIGTTPWGVATGAGSVWVSDFDLGTVVRVDPATGAPGPPIHVGNGPTSIAAAADQVWVVNSRDGTVSRIDPATNAVVATITVGDQPETVALGESAWVAVSSTAEIVRIDPVTDTIDRRLSVQSRPRGIALAGQGAWFTARAAPLSHRGGTLRVVGAAPVMPTSFDPADPTGAAWPVVYLTNDGLLGLKRVGGSDGSTVVPDLATSMPSITDGGLTYTFALRAGITYDDGTPVRALDVRRSIERYVSLTEPEVSLILFGSLKGIGECAEAPATCDLSTGIEVDDAAGTVIFRLTAPDAELVYKLTQPFAYVYPAETPRTIVKAPLPATGPYMAQPFDSDGGFRLVRNPSFREWSHEAQPDGYPDEIVWRIVPDGEAITQVEVGEADWTPEEVRGDRTEEVRTRFPDQVHTGPPMRTFFEFMNTSTPPFDNADVRRAVNLATDRARVVDVYGGPLAGRVTCQATPPGFPGYEPYCPYTVSPGTAWRAPDMTAARALVERAGVRGTSVTVRALDFPAHLAVGRYFADLLGDLGFEASMEPIAIEQLTTVYAMTAGIQMVGIWVLPGYPAPSSLITGMFTCPDFAPYPGSDLNYAAFCDKSIDARSLAAWELQSTDPAAANRAWAEVDRLIVDQSPAVAAFNPTGLEIVSKRVGNVQVHPTLRVLLSQVWVQ